MINRDELEGKCTRSAMVSINGIVEAARNTAGTVMVVVFGSQARGTATARSDLDVLYVAQNRHVELYDLFEKAIRRPQGIEKHSLFGHTAHSIKKKMNIYGTMEYWAMREGAIIYLDDKRAGSVLRRLVDYEDDASLLSACAGEWLKIAERYYSDGATYEKKYRRDDDFTCHMMYLSISSMIKSMLVLDGIRFPFTRTLKPLYDLLPDKSMIVDACSLDLISTWQEGPVHKNHQETVQALRLTQNIYSDTKKRILDGRGTIGY